MTSVEEKLSPRQLAFLGAFRTVASITTAAQIANIDRTTHYAWLREIPEYVEAFEEAKRQAAETLESEAVRRAMGYQEEIYFQGKQVGTVTKHSDILLIFLLKGLMPDKYAERTQLSLTQPTLADLLLPEAAPAMATTAVLGITAGKDQSDAAPTSDGSGSEQE